jgi:hypothetical protein
MKLRVYYKSTISTNWAAMDDGRRKLQIKASRTPFETECWRAPRSSKTFVAMSNIYFDFLDRLNDAAVDYAVLHNWESLRFGEVSDIDMAVAARDLGGLETAMREHYRVLNVFHYEASSFGFVLAPKNDLSSVFIADISTDYRWRGRIFFTDRELLRNRRQWNGYWIAGPAQEFAYLFVKKIYEKGYFPEHQRTRIGELVHDLGSEAQTVLSNLLASEWITWVLDRIRAAEWDAVEQRVPELRRSMRFEILKRDHLNSLRYWTKEIERFCERFRYPTGVAIAVLDSEGRCNRLLKNRFTNTFAGVFRQMIVIEPKPGRRLKQALRDRALLCRSTLIFRDYSSAGLHPPQNRKKQSLDFASSLVPSPDMVFIINSNSSGAARSAIEASGPVKESESGSTVAVLDGRAGPEDVARAACELLGAFLTKRYLQRRRVWF